MINPFNRHNAEIREDFATRKGEHNRAAALAVLGGAWSATGGPLQDQIATLGDSLVFNGGDISPSTLAFVLDEIGQILIEQAHTYRRHA